MERLSADSLASALKAFFKLMSDRRGSKSLHINQHAVCYVFSAFSIIPVCIIDGRCIRENVKFCTVPYEMSRYTVHSEVYGLVTGTGRLSKVNLIWGYIAVDLGKHELLFPTNNYLVVLILVTL